MNHGHIPLTANATYDQEFYYTSQELGGKDGDGGKAPNLPYNKM